MLVTSRYSYAETIERLRRAVEAAGNTVFAAIDQAAAAQSAGLALRPTWLLVFGNPRGGTPFMEAEPLVALDLPLKLLVWQEDAAVKLAYTPMSEIAARYGVTGKDAQIAAIDRALETLSATVT
jgi:uncharacterized protein (DUF302 family)